MKYCLSTFPEIDAMLRGKGRILIASDFDSTLCPSADTPSDARVTAAMFEVLRRATACERLTLALIIGRSMADVSPASGAAGLNTL
jgi:trehalose-6-phosphatase